MSTRAKLITIVIAGIAIVTLLLVTQERPAENDFRAAFDAEFISRPDGYPGLKEAYNFELPSSPRQMDPGLMYRALADEAVDVIDAFKTDGRIAAYDLRILEDDKNFFPPYHAAPLIRKDTLEEYPELEDVLNTLAGQISDEKMQELNYAVDEEREDPHEVAKNFLRGEGFIEEEPVDPDPDNGEVVIAGKHFTEQEVIGEMMSILIEYNTDITVERQLNLGGTIICFNALEAGDIDIYAEYTGTGLVNILEEDAIADPDESYERVSEVFEEEYDLIWLEPFGFNNTYTLTMREENAAELGIETISDLAEYLQSLSEE